MIIGIDNGKSGAIALLSEIGGVPPGAIWPMPLLPDGSRVDSRELRRMLQFIGPREEMRVVLEDCPQHLKQASALRSMATTTGLILGVLESLDLSPVVIMPHVWQKDILGKVPKGQTKPAALAAAESIWPGHDWRRTPASRTPCPDFIDAALIAEWGRRNPTRK